jgi:hypothetical protein
VPERTFQEESKQDCRKAMRWGSQFQVERAARDARERRATKSSIRLQPKRAESIEPLRRARRPGRASQHRGPCRSSEPTRKARRPGRARQCAGPGAQAKRASTQVEPAHIFISVRIVCNTRTLFKGLLTDR